LVFLGLAFSTSAIKAEDCEAGFAPEKLLINGNFLPQGGISCGFF